MRLVNKIVYEAVLALLELFWLIALLAINIGGALVIVGNQRAAQIAVIGSLQIDWLSAYLLTILLPLFIGVICGGLVGGEFRRKMSRAEMSVNSFGAAIVALLLSAIINGWRGDLGWLPLLVLLIITCFLASFALSMFGQQGEPKKVREPQKPDVWLEGGWVGTITD